MGSTARKGFFLFWTFFRSMMFAFTSGMAAIPSIEKAIVDKEKLLTDDEFWTYPPLGQSLPGVISIHNAMLLGNRIAGPFGAFMSVMGVILPAFLCMLVIAVLFQTVVDNPYIQGMIRGIRIISAALLLGNASRLLQNTEKTMLSLILVIAAITVPLFLGGSAFWTIIICGIVGIISVFLDPKAPEPDNGEGAGK